MPGFRKKLLLKFAMIVPREVLEPVACMHPDAC